MLVHKSFPTIYAVDYQVRIQGILVLAFLVVVDKVFEVVGTVDDEGFHDAAIIVHHLFYVVLAAVQSPGTLIAANGVFHLVIGLGEYEAELGIEEPVTFFVTGKTVTEGVG